jgi:phosphoribosylanthranilate isomerase
VRQVTLRAAALIAKSQPRPPSLVAVVGDELSIVPHLLALGFTIQFAAPIHADYAYRLTAGAPYLRVVRLAPQERTAVDLESAPAEIPVFDTAIAGRSGGTGRAFCWSRIARIAARRAVMVAGGLNSRNVGACIQSARPFAVDVRSGIETVQGKSIAKMRAFVRAVREADAAVYTS